MFNKFQKLQNLHTDKTEWTIRARAQSIWEGINRTTNEFKGLNVMLIDDSVTTEYNIYLYPHLCVHSYCMLSYNYVLPVEYSNSCFFECKDI